MSQGWKWGIGVGALIVFIGLAFIPAAFTSSSTDEVILATGMVIFAVGVLTMAISFYVHAKSLSSQPGTDNSSSISTGGKRKLVCDVCHKGTAVIQCTMHKTILCPTCLSGHYESRGCVYVPTIRRTSVKTARGAVASRS